MKKLMMFAAAMTIVGGAFAQNVGGGTCTPSGTCASVWAVKMNLRTTMGRTGKVAPNLCAPGASGNCIRFPNYPYVINGLLFECDCACDAFENATLELWSPRFKQEITVNTWTPVAHIIGNKKSAEIVWELEASDPTIGVTGDFELVGAGFGTYNGKYYTSFSGYAAGVLVDPMCQAVDLDANALGCDPAGYWLCDGTFDVTEPAPLFGTWAIKYNAAASKVYDANGKLPYPNWW